MSTPDLRAAILEVLETRPLPRIVIDGFENEMRLWASAICHLGSAGRGISHQDADADTQQEPRAIQVLPHSRDRLASSQRVPEVLLGGRAKA
jgi:hypothetical protein